MSGKARAARRWRRRQGLAVWRRLWRDGAMAVTLEAGAGRHLGVMVMLDGDVVLSVPRDYGRAEDVPALALLLRLLQARMAALGSVAFEPLSGRAGQWARGIAMAHGVAVPAWHLGLAWQWLGEAAAALGGGAMPAWPPLVLAWPVLAVAGPPLVVVAWHRVRDRAVRRLLAG